MLLAHKRRTPLPTLTVNLYTAIPISPGKNSKEFITKVSPTDKQVIIRLRDPTVNTNMFKTSLVDTTNNYNVPATIATQDLKITSIKMSTPDTKPRSKDSS